MNLTMWNADSNHWFDDYKDISKKSNLDFVVPKCPIIFLSNGL